MASQGVANHLQRIYNGRQQTRKIHPISASWNVNHSNISRSNGTELFLKEKPQTGAKTKSEVKTEIKNGKLPDISTRKLRERLVHLLAVNSYTRQEINSVFQKEGLRPCERQTVVHVLKDVAQLSRNVYSLRPNIWKEVDENWPYYNEKELQQLKRRKEQRLRAPNGSIELTPESNESQSSKNITVQPHLAENNSSKRTHLYNVEPQPAKKSLIELTPESKESQSLKRHKEQSLRASNSSIEVTPESNESQSSTNSTILHNPTKRTNLDNAEPQPTKKRRIEPVYSTSDNHTTSQPATSNSNAIEPPKYDFSDYTEITNLEQQQRYATAFARYHEEYMPLFQQTTELRNSFRELGAQILNMSKDCPEYENISERIAATFQILSSREQLHREQRVRYLHAKLAHIKRLITLFDSKRTKEIAMAYATAIAKKYELRYERLKSISDIEEVIGKTKPVEISNTILNQKGATSSTHEEIPPAKQECMNDILAEDLALSDSDSDDD